MLPIFQNRISTRIIDRLSGGKNLSFNRFGIGLKSRITLPAGVVLLLLVPVLMLSACRTTTETIVVGGPAQTIETGEEEEQPDVREADLPVLKVGESNRIRSMDPLFALNTATKRLITLAYEGLVRFDHNDAIQPAAAGRWEVSDDSLTYTFTLRRNLFFHDDESFAQGRGRRVNSRDIVRVFERMASRNVPPNAAGLFMNTIRGFEPYYLEQREIYFDEDREITQIAGLEATSDSTIVFRLLQSDRDFLAKLASPYAVIYPSEVFRFRDDGLHSHAVGTGPFRFESSIGDSIHVFLRNATYYGRDHRGHRLPLVSRVELMNVTDEMRLYRHFERGRLNMIVDAGPGTVDRVVDEDNQLLPDLRESYRLASLANPDPIILRYNAQNRFGLNRQDAASVIRHMSADRIAGEWQYPSLSITYQDSTYGQTNIGRVFRRFGEDFDNRLLIGFSQDQLPRALSRIIHESIDGNLRTDLVQRRVFSSDILLYLDYQQSVIPQTVHERFPDELMRIETDRYLLFDREIDGVRTNSLSWWIDFRQVRRADTPRDSEAARVQ